MYTTMQVCTNILLWWNRLLQYRGFIYNLVLDAHYKFTVQLTKTSTCMVNNEFLQDSLVDHMVAKPMILSGEYKRERMKNPLNADFSYGFFVPGFKTAASNQL